MIAGDNKNPPLLSDNDFPSHQTNTLNFQEKVMELSENWCEGEEEDKIIPDSC